jgi:hypothetical protein
MKAEMRRLFYHEGQAGPLLFPLAMIVSFLLAYTWYLVIVGIVLPTLARVVGAD